MSQMGMCLQSPITESQYFLLLLLHLHTELTVCTSKAQYRIWKNPQSLL